METNILSYQFNTRSDWIQLIRKAVCMNCKKMCLISVVYNEIALSETCYAFKTLVGVLDTLDRSALNSQVKRHLRNVALARARTLKKGGESD
jgi:hypothetical protein